MAAPQVFIDSIADEAVQDQLATGVLASITIAQAALESGYGQYAKGNNLFGIKGRGDAGDAQHPTSEYINGRWVQVVSGFRVYDSWSESIYDHSRFLLDNPVYARAGFFDAASRLDYAGAAQALQKAGYATDPQYAAKLIRIIEQYRLFDYDRQAAEEGGLIPMRLQHEWQWKQLGDALEGMYKKGLLTDHRWVQRAYARELTVSEVAWLNTIMIARQQGVDV